MAKKTNDQLYQQFLDDVLAAVPADSKADVEKALKLEQVASKTKEAVLARSDYSREMDALKEARESLDTEVAEARKNIDGWNKWYKDATKEFSDVKGKLKQYEDEFGNIEGDSKGRSGKSTLTDEEFQKRLTDELQKHDIAAISFANDLSKVQFDYFNKFKEVLDTDKLIESASKRGITLKSACDEFVAPKIKERDEKHYNEAIAKAKLEGAKEALAGHKLPMVSGPAEPHSVDLMSDTKVGRTPEDRIAAAVSRWNDSRSQAT